MLARLKARKESTPAAEPSLPSAPLPAPATVPVVVPSAEPVILPDLRNQITPKKSDLRNKITPRKTNLKKPWMKGKDLSYSGPKLGGAEQDIRERQRKEREAELALAEARALRVAAEENEARVVDSQIKDLVSYKDALISNSTQRQGKQYPLHIRKRDRSRTPSRTPTPSPSSSWSSVSESERRRATVRPGKGKDRRRSYSRSPSPERRPPAARNTERNIPGLVYGEERRGSHNPREFTPRRSPSRRPTPGTPPRSHSWHVASRRRRREGR